MLAPPTELYIYRPHALSLSTTPTSLFFLSSPVNLISFCPFITLLLKVKKIKAMENKSTNPSKEGKSGKIPPKRGQVMSKIFERLKGAVLPKNSKGRVKTSTDEGGSGSGSGSGSGNGGSSGSGGGNQ